MPARGLRSSTDSVRTPPELLRQIRKEFGKFYDPAPFNPRFDPSKHRDGLTTDWKKINFVNPPYSSVGPWVKKAHLEWKKNKTIILLIKLENLGRKYSTLLKGAEIRIFTEALTFPGYERKAAFTNVLVIMRARKRSTVYKFI